MAGKLSSHFLPFIRRKGLDFLLSDILAPAYEMLQIDQEVGSCVRPEIGNHSRKLDKIQEWEIRLSQNTFPFVSHCDLCGFVLFLTLPGFNILKGTTPNYQKDLFSKVFVAQRLVYLLCKA